MSTIMSVVAGAPKWVGCTIGGALITLYSSAGGLKAGAWVNMVQLAVKMAGFAIALPLALSAVGGWSAVAGMPVPSGDYWSFWAGGGSGIVYLALLGPAFIVSPGILQKIYGARDDRAVRLGVGLNALGLFLYAIIPVILGMVARLRFPALQSNDLALPMILMNGLPVAVGTLGLAAVFSAELSAADAVLFMLTTSLSQDLYKRFVNPAADERRVLAVARLTTIVAGALGTALAIVSPTVIGVLTIFYTLLGVSLFVPILGGLYVPAAGTRHAQVAMLVGVATVLTVQFATGGRGYGSWSPALLGIVAAVAGFGLMLLAAPRRLQVPAD
jgi:SSS family solute:Na+ symporter